jgi:hypothetical protein
MIVYGFEDGVDGDQRLSPATVVRCTTYAEQLPEAFCKKKLGFLDGHRSSRPTSDGA